MNEHIIKSLKKQITKFNLAKQPKEVLLLILEILQITEQSSLIEMVIKQLETLDKNSISAIEQEMLEIRLSAFLKEISKIKYEKRIDTSKWTFYFYSSHIDLYFNKNIHKIEEIIEDLLQEINKIEFLTLTITDYKKSKKNTPFSISKNDINKELKVLLQEKDISLLKIRFFKNSKIVEENGAKQA